MKFDGYDFAPDAAAIAKSVERIAANLEDYNTDDILKKCFSVIDLTSLKTEDTTASIAALVRKVNELQDSFPDMPLPASVAVYPNFVGTVASARRTEDILITSVAASFPASQTFLQVKVLECSMAVEAGADEIDIVLPYNKFACGDYDACIDEIRFLRETVDKAGKGRRICLKVILETGLSASLEEMAGAAFLAMEGGADFLKTSTGKVPVNATPTAAFVLCGCIAEYYKATGRKVGFKAAGGISTVQDALCYYAIVQNVLGKEWLSRDLFRLGASRLANNLLSGLKGETVRFF